MRNRIAVVIPCFRVRKHILEVLKKIGPETELIYVVDDKCPEETGHFVEENIKDPRIQVIHNLANLGVGGATLAGMMRAVDDGADVVVKIDGDGQMDPALIPIFAGAVLSGEADYAKGNRFFEPEGLVSMPLGRLLGNSGLSFVTKLSTGYWHTFDPTNGFIAIDSSVFSLLPVDKIAKHYFFESDLLFRLNILTARVVDIPMRARYALEKSNLNPALEMPRFAAAHLRNFGKRIIYNYFVRNFSIASVELAFGLVLLLFGIVFGLTNWRGDVPATAGTVMTAALPVIIGFQLLLAFLNYDIESVPRVTLHLHLKSFAQPMQARGLLTEDEADSKVVRTDVEA